MSENTTFRLMAYALVDTLNLPENADILEQFKAFNSQTENGWTFFEAATGENLKWVKVIQRYRPVPPSQLTVEQTVRWNIILEQCNIIGSGISDTLVFLLAQRVLGVQS